MVVEIDKKIIDKVKNITLTDYIWQDGHIDVEDAASIIEELLCEISRLEEKIDNMEQNIESNYEPKKVDLYAEYGISDRDFY